jgi:hypothetical protein
LAAKKEREEERKEGSEEGGEEEEEKRWAILIHSWVFSSYHKSVKLAEKKYLRLLNSYKLISKKISPWWSRLIRMDSLKEYIPERIYRKKLVTAPKQ